MFWRWTILLLGWMTTSLIFRSIRAFAAHEQMFPITLTLPGRSITFLSTGAGTVLVWDRGTWEPIEDPHAGLAKGHLKFRLHGEKLRGGWTLVRIKSRDPRQEGKTWLLIKERDEAAVRLRSTTSPLRGQRAC